MRKFIEGYDEQKALEVTERDYWQDVIRAEQNKLVVQETLEAIETHFDIPCAVVYIGPIKGVIPVHEFGIDKESHVTSREDAKVKEKLDNSYRFLRSVVGQKIALIIKGHDKKENLFTASRKDAIEWMRKRTEEEIAKGSKTMAVVRNVAPYRAIVDIGGFPAILPASEFRHGWTDDLTDYLQIGDHLIVELIDFDKEAGRAVVSKKCLVPDPWESLEIIEKSEYNAEIMGVREDGCFFRVKTKSGYVDGFFKHPKHEYLTRGDKALVKILNINKDKRRILGLYVRPVKVS
jgi:ribosomal protein S1